MTADMNTPTRLRPSLDLQTHLTMLEEKGLLVRIDRPINKDTELHPLVRCQFVGGLPEDERHAFLFTNVVDSHGRRYDIPVVVGALAASPKIHAIGLGRRVEEIGDAWTHAIANPIAPVDVASPPCQDIIVKGDALREPGGGLASLPVPISTPGFDAAPYLTATLCITRDPENGIQNIGTYRAALKDTDRLGVRMSSRTGGAGGYLHWRKYNERRGRMPCAIVIEGLIDPDVLEPEGPFGESNGYVALEDFNLSMQVTAITRRRSPVFASIISQVTPSESSIIKKVALEPLFLAHLRDHLSLKSVRRVVMHEPLSNVRPIIFVQFANGAPRTEIWRGLQGAAARQAVNSWSARRRCGGSWACRRSPSDRPGTAIRSAIGPRHGTSLLATRWPANGRRTAKTPGRAGAAA